MDDRVDDSEDLRKNMCRGLLVRVVVEKGFMVEIYKFCYEPATSVDKI